jgi:hypothetical protein
MAPSVLLLGASLVVTAVGFWRKGLVGFGLGLLAVAGAAVAFIPIYFGLAIAIAGLAVSADYFWYALWAALGVGLFAIGSYVALRRGLPRQPVTARRATNPDHGTGN